MQVVIGGTSASLNTFVLNRDSVEVFKENNAHCITEMTKSGCHVHIKNIFIIINIHISSTGKLIYMHFPPTQYVVCLNGNINQEQHVPKNNSSKRLFVMLVVEKAAVSGATAIIISEPDWQVRCLSILDQFFKGHRSGVEIGLGVHFIILYGQMFIYLFTAEMPPKLKEDNITLIRNRIRKCTR